MEDEGGQAPQTTQPTDGQAPASVQDVSQVMELRNEAARYRVERNAALREAHALRQVTTAHNIEVPGPDTYAGLKVKGGQVVGEFKYTPPAARAADGGQQQTSGRPPSSTSGLTREALKGMTPEAISKLPWSDVTAALKG